MLRSLTRPVLRPLVRALTEARDFFDPRQLFSNSSTIGAIYAYDDFAYLYQKFDGSTPVTALEQPVGRVLDQRYGGLAALSATELVTNGGFDSATGWTLTGSLSAISGGALRVGDAASAATAKQTGGSFLAGKTYAVSFTIVSRVSGSIRVYFGPGAVAATTSVQSAGSYRLFVTMPSNQTEFTIQTQNNPADIVLDNISVRELPGLHAYQSTDAARPVLKGTPRYANFDGTDDRLVTATGGGSTTGFLLVTGINVGGAGTARTIFSDRGTNTGYKVEVDAANNLVFTAGNGASFVSCTGPAITAGTSYVIACWHDGTNLNIKVGSGAVTSQAFATASAGTAAISIGRDNGAATGFYNGRLYPTVYIKDSTATVGAIDSTMAWVAGKGGIAL